MKFLWHKLFLRHTSYTELAYLSPWGEEPPNVIKVCSCKMYKIKAA